jgi:hypothetical protein
MHRDAGDLHLAELRQHRPDTFGRGSAHRTGDHHQFGPIELALNDFP